MRKKGKEVRKITWVASLGFLLLVLPKVARSDHRELPGPGSEPMRLDSLIGEVKEHNAELRAAKAEAQSKEAEIGPRGAYDDPMLAVEAMNYPVNNFRADQYSMTGTQLSLSQRVQFPGKLTRLRDSARHEFEARRESARSKELMLIKDIKVLYYELFAAYKRKDLLGDQRKILGQIITVTRNNFALNKTPQAEVLNLQVEDAMLTDQILTIEKQIKLILGEINHMLGRASHDTYLYSRPEEIRPTPFDFKKLTEHAIYERALARNPGLKAREAELHASDEKLSYAIWNYLPDFTFKVGYTFRQPNAMDNGTDFVSGMVGITLPLWAGSKQSEEKKGAEAEKVKAEALLDDERYRLAHEIHATYVQLEEARDRIKLYESGILPLVKQSVVAARSGYTTGKVQYSTLLSLLSKRYQTESAYYEALASFESKIAELEAITGGDLGEPTS